MSVVMDVLADLFRGVRAQRSIFGAYPVRGDVGSRLLEALPPILAVPRDGDTDAVLGHVAAEVALDRPGQQVVLDRTRQVRRPQRPGSRGRAAVDARASLRLTSPAHRLIGK